MKQSKVPVILAAVMILSPLYAAKDIRDSDSDQMSYLDNGPWHDYTIHLASNPEYKGGITKLRLDPVSTGRTGDYIKIKSISWKNE